MAITLVGSTFTASATAATPPEAQEGDLCLAFAGNGTAATVPNLATGWNDAGSRSGNLTGMRTAWAWYTDTMDQTPTFTNAGGVLILALRGVDPNTPIGAYTNANGSSTSISFPALTPFQKTDGTSWFVAAVVGNRPDVVIPTPTGLTMRQASGTRPGWFMGDTNGGVSTWTAKTVTVSRAAGFTTCEVEVRAKTTVTVDLVRALRFRSRIYANAVRALPYEVRTWASAVRELRFEVNTFVGITRVLPWGMEAAGNVLVSLDRTMVYRVRGFVDTVRALRFRTRNFVSAARALPYRIRTLASLSRQLPYHVRTLASLTRQIPYRLRTLASIQRALPFRVRASSQITRTSRFGIRAYTEFARILRYGISSLVNEKLLKVKFLVGAEPNLVEVYPYPDEVSVPNVWYLVEAGIPENSVSVWADDHVVATEAAHPVVTVQQVPGYAVSVPAGNPVVQVEEN